MEDSNANESSPLANGILFENFDGSYNIGLTPTNKLSITSGSFTTNYGEYLIKFVHNNSTCDNVEFNVVTDENAGAKLTHTNYSASLLNCANTLNIPTGSIESLKLSSIQFNDSNDTNWYILCPEKTIGNINDISSITFYNTIAFNSLGNGATETFYYEIYNGTSWFQLASFSSNNENIQYDITSHVVSNNSVIKMRARVAGFQKKDYLNIGSYAIEYIYT